MKLFKNGLNLKWILLVIVLVVSIGYAIASTNPIISAETSHFGGINITQINSTGTGINTFAGRVDFNSTNGDNIILSNGINASIVAYNSAGLITIGNILQSKKIDINLNTNKLYFSGIMASSPQANAVCFNSGSTEVTYNGGSTTCTASSETVKHNIESMTPYNTPDNFMKIRPVTFIYNYDSTDRNRDGIIAQEICPLYPGVCNINYQGNATFVKIIVDEKTGKGTGALYSDGTIAKLVGVDYELYTSILTYKLQEQQFQLEIQASQIRNICSNNPQLCS